MKKAEIAVLIPCYNEEVTISKVVKDFKKVLPTAKIYVYDNNSTDKTAALAKAAGAEVRYEHQQGKGNVLRRMFREVDADCYILVDGDDTYPAEAAPEMIKAVVEHGADMVVGDRLSSTYAKENKRKFHNFGNKLVQGIINKAFHAKIKDVMTGYRAFSYQFVKTFPVLSKGFEIETEMTLHAVDKNMQIENVVVEYRDRPAGSRSKLNTIPDGMRVLWTIVRLFRDYKPGFFWSFIAFILYVIAAALFIPVLVDFTRTGLVARFPSLMVSGVSAILGTLCLFTGIILKSIVRSNRRDFEFKLQQAAQSRKK
ncbi:glycosyltransferase [Candidatus Saccharibacteria bacterium]|nr:glycosyltransferase [Candidatus Saccharibacteria bacterium]MBR6961727.1 glycosyltransferase [Candidatus Saccharibacteria bacterium]